MLSTCPCCPNTSRPDGYYEESIPSLSDEEMDWSDDKHLSLGFPTTVNKLDHDLNNPSALVDQMATNYGCCSSFQVMSDEGLRVLTTVIAGIEKHSQSCPRIPKLIRGGTFRNSFLNRMGHSSAVLRHVSLLAGCEMIYHPMKIHQLHINMKPDKISATENENLIKGVTSIKNVDRWHCDSTPFVMIVFCTNPDEYTGGTLQYFNGTKEEGLSLLNSDAGLPEDRVLDVGRQEKGYGVFMQGWRVFHQVTPVLTGDSRTTIVFSFHPRNVLALEACQHLSGTYAPVDPLHVIMPDWVRFRTWKVTRRLELLEEHWAPSVLSLSQQVPISTRQGGDKSDSGSTYEALFEAASKCYIKLKAIVDTLPYCSDRDYFSELLAGAIQELTACLECKYPEPLGTEAVAADFKLSLTSVADVEESVVDTENGGGNKMEQMDVEFRSSIYGLPNLLGAVQDIDECIQDVMTLQENVSKLVYF